MSSDFIGDILNALKRVLPPDTANLREILIISGMPEETENIRYLGFNRQVIEEENRSLEFSAVAVINNRRVKKWRLEGYRKTVSQVLFRWTRNHLDLFLNSIRCSQDLMDLLASSSSRYTLMGILKVEERPKTGLFKRKIRYVRPVVTIPGIDEEGLSRIVAFEKANEISKSGLKGLPLMRKAGQGVAGH
jgi:hypothetical protein